MTHGGQRWWVFFGELFVLIPVVIDGHKYYTSNKWYRWALIKMFEPSEYMEVYRQASKPANDNISCAIS